MRAGYMDISKLVHEQTVPVERAVAARPGIGGGCLVGMLDKIILYFALEHGGMIDFRMTPQEGRRLAKALMDAAGTGEDEEAPTKIETR